MLILDSYSFQPEKCLAFSPISTTMNRRRMHTTSSSSRGLCWNTTWFTSLILLALAAKLAPVATQGRNLHYLWLIFLARLTKSISKCSRQTNPNRKGLHILRAARRFPLRPSLRSYLANHFGFCCFVLLVFLFSLHSSIKWQGFGFH